MDKRKAWNFAIGLQAVDDKTPSPELLELAEREISGEITTAEVIEQLRMMYSKTADAEKAKKNAEYLSMLDKSMAEAEAGGFVVMDVAEWQEEE